MLSGAGATCQKGQKKFIGQIKGVKSPEQTLLSHVRAACTPDGGSS